MHLFKKINIFLVSLLAVILIPQAKGHDNENTGTQDPYYKIHSQEVKDFEVFKTECADQELVMIFGTGHAYEEKHINSHRLYPKNTYLVDINPEAKPDLFMNVEIENLPTQYVGQFDLIIFEGFYVYDRPKAFKNVYNLLKKGGTFLVGPSDDISSEWVSLRKSLEGCGFTLKERIEGIRDSNNNAKNYVGCIDWTMNVGFLVMEK